jgi:hypothetical protein
MVNHPELSLRECAIYFNVTQSWLSTIINSDGWKDYYARVVDEHTARCSQNIIEQTEVLAGLAVDVLTERLEKDRDSLPLRIVKETAEMSLKALGYGGRPVSVQINDPENVRIGLVDSVVLENARRKMKLVQNAEEDEGIPALPPAA